MFNPNHVSVTVVSAKNLTGKGKNGKNDAFVVIHLDGKKFQTSIQKKSVAPFWEEECEFFFDNKYSELVLTVYHRNFLGFDDFIGQVRLPLDEVCELPRSLNPSHRPPNRWFPLKGKSGKNDEQKYRGELEIRLLFTRKQPPIADGQTLSRSRSPSVNSFTLRSRDSSEHQKRKDKTATLPANGSSLRKKDFMGSMPALIGGNGVMKVPRPPSPTGSISSVKKRSLLSKLRSSASFHLRPGRLGECETVSDLPSERNSGSGASSPTFRMESPAQNKRRSFLETLKEHQSQDKPSDDDHQANATNMDGFWPEPVIKIQKRGGGVLSIGGDGIKRRPVSAIIGSEKSMIAGLPNRFTLPPPVQDTGVENTQFSLLGLQHTSNSSSPQDEVVNVHTAKEDLIAIVKEQRAVLTRQRGRIRELEDYIDQLLLRVMTTQPELLRSDSIEEPTKKRATPKSATRRSSLSFNFWK